MIARQRNDEFPGCFPTRPFNVNHSLWQAPLITHEIIQAPTLFPGFPSATSRYRVARALRNPFSRINEILVPAIFSSTQRRSPVLSRSVNNDVLSETSFQPDRPSPSLSAANTSRCFFFLASLFFQKKNKLGRARRGCILATHENTVCTMHQRAEVIIIIIIIICRHGARARVLGLHWEKSTNNGPP